MISESRLADWARQGPVLSAEKVHKEICGVLYNPNADYYGALYKIFLHGSYRNGTNLLAPTEVDIIVQAYSVRANDPNAKSIYRKEVFRTEVVKALREKYGNCVTEGEFSIRIAGDRDRPEVDLVISLPIFERKPHVPSPMNNMVPERESAWLFAKSGAYIISYPYDHFHNLADKDKKTRHRLKPMVRIWKNIRKRLIEAGTLDKKVSPPYFIEGMLCNLPDSIFSHRVGDSFCDALDWLRVADQEKLMCANGVHRLLADDDPNSMPVADLRLFLDSLWNFWNNY